MRLGTGWPALLLWAIAVPAHGQAIPVGLEPAATKWKVEQLEDAVSQLQHGRSFDEGRALYQSTRCVACHRMNGEGNEYGPDLTKLDPKLPRLELLRQILEPSAAIHRDYQSYTLMLKSGESVTGLIVAERLDSLKIVENPLVSAEPRVIKSSEIENRSKASASLMPDGLLDRLTRGQILDLLAFVVAGGNDRAPIYQPAQ
jgi:putative heme-binding domain-containing protein